MIKLELEKNIEINTIQHTFLSFIYLFFIIIPIIVFGSYLFLVSTNYNFPIGKTIEIEEGDSLNKIGKKLENANIINSAKLFSLARFKYEDAENIQAGKYTFNKEMNTWEIFEKMKNIGPDPDEQQRLTALPHEANYVLAWKFAKKMENIEEDDFIVAAKDFEGMLMPETYNFNLDATSKDVVDRFVSGYKQELKKYNIEFKNSEEELKILTIASLIEAEANSNYETRRHVSGIIFNRLKKNMSLQIDAPFLYIKKIFPISFRRDGKKISRTIYKSDYKLTSKYNTYKYPGLPPGPINNPSIGSIRAALDPMETKDIYYITDKDGVFHYSTTGVQHNINVKKYLRN